MSAVQKLQHLKGYLRGEAFELVENFSLTNENYETAWQLLQQRYDDPYELTRFHIRTLTTLPACKDSAADLRRLLNRATSTVLALRNLNRPVDNWHDWIIYHIMQKVDRNTCRAWEERPRVDDAFPTWPNLEAFLVSRLRAMSAMNDIPKLNPSTSSYSSHSKKQVRSHVLTKQPAESSRFACPCCKEEHAIYQCHNFRNMSPQDRRLLVANKRLCFNCLDSKHMASACKSTKKCRFCDASHNSLLHLESSSESQQQVAVNHSSVSSNIIIPQVLLATAILQIRASNGIMHEFRALLDQGSQASIITERAAQLLNLPRQFVDIDVFGIAATPSGRVNQMISTQIYSRFGEFCNTINALVMNKVSHNIDRPAKAARNWSHLSNLTLADPQYKGQQIDILIGADLYGSLLLPGVVHGIPGSPVAQNTLLGWIISGLNNSPNSSQSISINFATISEKIDDCLERFWNIEDIGARRSKTLNEELCESHFINSFTRDTNGRFHVRIPFKASQPVLGKSLDMATRRQLQMEKKFEKNPKFAHEYEKFMSQYLQLGHMKLIGDLKTIDTDQQSHYYIPHHAVIKESSSTTKLRVVFDASSRSTNGLSLNEQMLPGPRLQDDLSSIVMRFRKHNIVFTADVERMYRQIIIDEPDANYQRIVWRPHKDNNMQVFQLSTVTYGTTSAPYLAVKALQTLAELEKENYPIGAEIAQRDFYVDDVLTGFDNIELALCGQAQLRQLMQSGGFELKKWTSNNSSLLDHLPNVYCECHIPLEFNMDQQIKTLGIQWSPVSDQFSFKIAFIHNASDVTKRQFLSDAARLYDPLGWLSPSVILVKIMFQQLWQLKLDWDELLPQSLLSSWHELRQAFIQLQSLRIHRWIETTTTSKIELHGFCDASTKAYAAAVYVRTTSIDNVTAVHLICSKTKVAPLKTISLPRLELCGAILLSQLMLKVQMSMQFHEHTSHCWTDSTIVLSWINGSPSRWTVFVANRISEIQRNFPIEHWHHVSSEDNPADCASRGVPPEQLATHLLWWSGPSWLKKPSSNWPTSPIIGNTTEEMKNSSTVFINLAQHTSWELKHQFSSFRRLIRITVYLIRFIHNSRSTADKRLTGPLHTHELRSAKLIWMKDAQHEHFEEEIKNLKRNEPLSRSSVLRSLNPILHSDGLLRVGGRLVNSLMLPDQTKTPIIIPRRCHLAELLVRDSHEQTFHGSPSLMLAQLRRQYWLIDGPRHVRTYVKRCNKCFRFSSSLGHQIMGALPVARITPSRPFTHTAMDYSGAVMIRSTRGRGHHATKGYISVFVCLVTKAIHIEIVSDLTSAAFIAAYKRFTGRRGVCSDLYSDNATNYVGAAAIFTKSELELGFNDALITTLATMGTNWHFSPPLSPHFNGLAESAIRSVKHHMRRVIGESKLTFEELSTFIVQVECCLNSRPLYPMSNEPTDFSVLTPAHFLIGSELNTIPERSLLATNPQALTRWQQVQQMVQRFWCQWSSEYLHTLQQRKKWQTKQPDISVDDLVLIMEDNRPPSYWPLGRVIEVHPGRDGNVRVVTLRTATQTMKRSIVKLARLPTQASEPSSTT